jgi:hypothetical protein
LLLWVCVGGYLAIRINLDGLTLLIADEAPRLKQTFASEMDGERARARGSYDST